MPVISINVYKGQGIWRLSSKYWLNNETLYWYISNNPLIISNFSKDFVFGKFKTSRASHGCEAMNNDMCGCKRPDKLVRQAREPSEEFLD